jgi:hypothetical protein
MSTAGEGPQLDGMTVNERLFELGLTDAFDAAIVNRDRDAALRVLERAGLTSEQALETVTAILADPKRYGY